MDLEALRIFVRVAELASFTRAAEQLGMPKARASQRMHALEADLGVRLLQRTTRSVALTPDGQQLLPRARRLVVDADDLAALFQTSGTLRGRVRIDLPINIARDFVIPRLPELLGAHPQLELQLSTTDQRVEVVRAGFDCVVSVGSLAPSGLTAQRIGVLAMASCASPGYLVRRGIPTTLEDLAMHELVHYSLRFADDPPTFEYLHEGRYLQLPMRASVTVNNADAYRAACLAGLGIIQAPRIGVRSHLADGALVELLPHLPSQPMPVWLVHAHGRTVPKRVRAVMNWLTAVLRARLDRGA